MTSRPQVGGADLAAERCSTQVAWALPDPVVVIDASAKLVWANPAAEARFGWRVGELQGCSLTHLVHPDDLDTALLSLTSVQDKRVGTVIELRLLDDTNQYSRFEIRGAGLQADGDAHEVVLSLRESTDRRRWEIARGDADLLNGILDATATMTILLHANGEIRGANRGLTRLLHRALESTIGLRLLDLVAVPDQPAVSAELALAAEVPGRRSFEARLTTAQGGTIPVALTVVNLLDDRAVGGLVVSGADITALVEARERLEHLATHDDLTGLPNRAALRARLEALVRADQRGYTLLFGDVDGLKQINDRHGHRAGDLVLRATAERLRGVVRPTDIVARLSGDEFAIVAATIDPHMVTELEARIADAMTAPVHLADGTDLRISITTGGAPLTAADVDDALEEADEAMYAAKRLRRG